MDLVSAVLEALLKGEKLMPQITTSRKYKHWISIKDFKRCVTCKNMHGKIWFDYEISKPNPPAHLNCRCKIKSMEAITAGTATINGINGADWEIKKNGELPEYYISKSEAIQKGWKPGKWPSSFAPGKMITSGIYKNRNGHLPHKSGRIWYEADINYKSGRRNSQRIVWSNDGLVFVTYDHYETFYGIK